MYRLELCFDKDAQRIYIDIVGPRSGRPLGFDGLQVRRPSASTAWKYFPSSLMRPSSRASTVLGCVPAATSTALKFFDWAYKNGGKMASDLDYVPLPESLIKQVRGTWKAQIKGVTPL